MKKNRNLRIAAAPRWAVISLALLAILALALTAFFLFQPAGARKNPSVTHGTRDASQKNPTAGYIVVTEMTDAGRALPAPSLEKPVYYLAHYMGQHDAGAVSSGTNQMSSSWLQKAIDTTLAAHGCFPAGTEHEPTQLLIFMWGAQDKIELPADAADNKTLLSRAKAIGGQKFADQYAQALKKNDLPRFAARDDATGTLVREVQSECHFLIVSAVDVAALKKNTRKLLWTTRISTLPKDNSVEATAMSIGIIDHAAYFFGRETPPKIVK